MGGVKAIGDPPRVEKWCEEKVSFRKATAVSPLLAVQRTCERGLQLCNCAVCCQAKNRQAARRVTGKETMFSV